MRTWMWLAVGLLASASARAEEAPDAFIENFETPAAAEKPAEPSVAERDAPSSIMVLEGDFKLTMLSGTENRWALCLPGQPVGDFNFLFGPRMTPPVEIGMMVMAERKGRRMPRFGIGWGGENGLRMYVTPAAKKIELYRNLNKLAEAPFDWETSGKWCQLKLKISQDGGTWKLAGTVTQQVGVKTEKPTVTSVSAELSEEPRAGRASAWGQPFSGQPIYYDNLEVKPVAD